MKMLTIVIKPERLEDLKSILTSAGANGMMITNIMGFGNQKGYNRSYRGTKFNVNLLPKIKVETVVNDETAALVCRQITDSLSTDEYGDGKIFVIPVEDAVRIRTGERGESAL